MCAITWLSGEHSGIRQPVGGQGPGGSQGSALGTGRAGRHALNDHGVRQRAAA